MNRQDIRFSPIYNPVGKPAEYAHGNWEGFPLIDANSIGGFARVNSVSEITNIPDNILRNVGYKVHVLQDGSEYMLVDWSNRNNLMLGWKLMEYITSKPVSSVRGVRFWPSIDTHDVISVYPVGYSTIDPDDTLMEGDMTFTLIPGNEPVLYTFLGDRWVKTVSTISEFTEIIS